MDVKNIYSKTRHSFSYLFMAFVLSLFCFPQISIPLNNISEPSTISDVGEAATTSNITWKSETLNGNTYYYTELGTYPQMYYSGSTPTSKTGKTYTVGSKTWTEYSLSGQKYVSGSQTVYNTSYTFKNGTSVGSTGATKWFKVEPIKWWIIDGTNPNTVSGTKEIRVISDVALAANIPFSTGTNNLWSSSNVRTWLNGTFLTDSGLSSYKTSVIKNETVKNNTSSSTSDGSGANTSDYVYLMSYDELNKYSPKGNTTYYLSSHRSSGGYYNDHEATALAQFGSRTASPSDFAIANYAVMESSYKSDYRTGTTNWLLRSAAGNDIYTAGSNGVAYGLSALNQRNLTYLGIRPCLTLKYEVKQASLTWTPEVLNGHIYYYTELGTYNSKPIKWWIIDGQNPATATRVDVISDTILEEFPFSDGEGSVTWQDDKYSISGWLNNTFYKNAGLNSGFVVSKTNTTGDFLDDTTYQTQDYVWLLSYTEMTSTYCPASDPEGKYYLASHSATGGEVDQSSEAETSTIERNSSRMAGGEYWLRSEGLSFGSVNDRACIITEYGALRDKNKTLDCGIRPCLRLDNSSKVVKALTFDNLILSYPGITKASNGSYHITDYTGLVAMSDYSYSYNGPECFSDMTFYLDNDIDCTALEFDFRAIRYFSGTLDGQGHSIINLNCIDNAPAYQGTVAEFDTAAPMACFIWATSRMTLSNINFLNLCIGTSTWEAPSALIGGYVFTKTPYYGQITLVNVYCERSALTEGFISGFIVDATNWQVNIGRCTMIEKNQDIYEMSSIPNIKGCSAFIGAVTANTTINIGISFAYGFYYTLLPTTTSDTGITGDIVETYLFGIDPGDVGGEFLVGATDRDTFISILINSRKVYWDFNNSNSMPWAYNDNFMLGLPYHPLVAIVGDIVKLDKIESWVTPNMHTPAEILARLQAYGFTEAKTPW